MVIPDELIAQVRVFLSAPGFEPSLGSPAVWQYVELLDAEEEVPTELKSEVEDWVRHQRDLQARAMEVAEELDDAWPVPTQEQVLDGSAVFPPHYGTEWWLTICGFPWARDLDKALERAESQLDEVRGN